MKNLSLTMDRLVLRDFRESDWQAVHKYGSDPQVVQYVEFGPNTKEETQNFIKRAILSQQEEPRRNYELAVVLKTEGHLIGGCRLYVPNLEHREGQLGYCFNRHFWAQGYATETARALLGFGFDKLGLHRILSTCDPRNIASKRVLEKIGMQRECRLREHRWVKGRWRDSFLYGILDHEWKTLLAESSG